MNLVIFGRPLLIKLTNTSVIAKNLKLLYHMDTQEQSSNSSLQRPFLMTRPAKHLTALK